MHYSTEELAEAAGLSVAVIKILIHRRQFFPEAERVGTGRAMQFTRRDAIQARLFGIIADAGGTPRQAMMAWAKLAIEPDQTQFGLWLANVGLGVEIAPANAPCPAETHRFVADMRVLLRDLVWRLQSIEARRSLSNPRDFPHRFGYQSPEPGAPWFVVLADGTEGAVDAECVAALCDAFERRDSILVAARTREALSAVVRVIDRMTAPAVAAPVQ